MHPNLDRAGPVPLFRQLKAWIRDQISSGEWPANYKLQAEADLAEELQVSRGTLRKAIAELTHEGLLVRSHGRGTFVAAKALSQSLASRMVTISEDLISRGIPFKTEVLLQAVKPATNYISAFLSVAPGAPLFCLRRLRIVEGQPLIILNNYVVHHFCLGIERMDFTHYRLFEALEQHYHHTLVGGCRMFQARLADAKNARLLEIGEGDPVMYMEQLTYLDDGAPIEFSELWLRGDRFRLSAEVRRDILDTGGVFVAVVDGIKTY